MSIPNRLHHRVAGGLSAVQSTNFRHLYFDIAWFGVLSGSTLAFLSVYMVRLGATGLQIGLVNAGPGLVTMLLALPAGMWLNQRPVDRWVFRSSIAFRFFYLLWIPIPFLLTPSIQIDLLIITTFLMSIPGTMLAVGFNALFAEAVPQEFRGKVAGMRNALLAITLTTTSITCGFLLDRLSFPLGYVLVFAIGFIGAAMSSIHLGRIRGNVHEHASSHPVRRERNLAAPGQVRTIGDAVRSGFGLRNLTHLPRHASNPIAILRGPFAITLGCLFLFHLAQYMATPLYPLYWVEELGISDLTISLGNALFYSFLFLGSTQIVYLIRRWGNHQSMVIGVLLLSFYPALTALTQEIGMFLFTAMVGGLFTAISAGVLGIYLLDKVPEGQRPLYLSWYIITLYGAVFLGSLLGPVLAPHLGLTITLFVIAGGRGLSGLVLWRWGR
jgi:MFS family permease